MDSLYAKRYMLQNGINIVKKRTGFFVLYFAVPILRFKYKSYFCTQL